MNTSVGAALAAKRCNPEAVLDRIETGADLIVGLGNGEPVTVIDAIEDGAEALEEVMTEYGVAELRGQPIRERTRRLIGIAHPAFREELEREARTIGYI